MNQILKKEIQNKVRAGNILFYNSKGNNDAFKLMVRHLNFAINLGFAKQINNGTIKIKKKCFLVDFEQEVIEVLKKGDELVLIQLEEFAYID